MARRPNYNFEKNRKAIAKKKKKEEKRQRKRDRKEGLLPSDGEEFGELVTEETGDDS